MLSTSGNDIIFGVLLLKHQPLHFHIVARMAPITLCIQIAKVEAVLKAKLYTGKRSGDFASNKSFATNRALVIEENPITCIDAIGLTVVYGNPVTVKLGNRIGAAWIERRSFFLGRFLCQTKKFRCAGLIKA